MVEVGETDETGRGGMGTFGRNGSEGRSNTHVLSATYHGETSTAASRLGTGDTWVISSAGSGSNAVINDLHRETTDNRGVVSRFATNILIMRRQDRLQME